MTCVICKKRNAEPGYTGNDIVPPPHDSVTCFQCRGDNYPKHMSREQYQRYWIAFTKKWREENDVCNM
jgi:hypothetical protein